MAYTGDKTFNNIDLRVEFPGTLRDWFAGQALAGLCANSIAGSHHRPSMRAEEAWQQADAMLAARESKP